MNTWWTSDFHFNHFNIIAYTGRPFKSVEEMNSTIINRFNERVKENDVCFFLGDLAFKSGSGRGEGEPQKPQELLKQLNCKTIIMVEGNHDRNGKNGFKTIIQSIVINYGGYKINLTHNPEHADFRFPINIVGHAHEKWFCQRLRQGEAFTDCINVSVEQNNYYPFSWDEINKRYYQWLKTIEQ
jgi:calcineurin-like phosphoesterase family protein